MVEENLLTVKLICSKEEFVFKHLDSLKAKFSDRGYPIEMVEENLQRGVAIERLTYSGPSQCIHTRPALCCQANQGSSQPLLWPTILTILLCASGSRIFTLFCWQIRKWQRCFQTHLQSASDRQETSSRSWLLAAWRSYRSVTPVTRHRLGVSSINMVGEVDSAFFVQNWRKVTVLRVILQASVIRSDTISRASLSTVCTSSHADAAVSMSASPSTSCMLDIVDTGRNREPE